MNLAGLPAHTCMLGIYVLSGTTAPAATTAYDETVACLTVAPMPTKALFYSLEPCSTTLGPT